MHDDDLSSLSDTRPRAGLDLVREPPEALIATSDRATTMMLRHSPPMLLLLSPLLVVGIITVLLALRFAPEGPVQTIELGPNAVQTHGPA